MIVYKTRKEMAKAKIKIGQQLYKARVCLHPPRLMWMDLASDPGYREMTERTQR